MGRQFIKELASSRVTCTDIVSITAADVQRAPPSDWKYSFGHDEIVTSIRESKDDRQYHSTKEIGSRGLLRAQS